MNNVEPDLITFSTLIKGHCAAGDIEQGLRLLSLMQRRGIKPDAILFNSILDGCAHKQMRTLTEQVLRDMEAAGVAPSNFTLSILVKVYSRLMSACIANGETARALEVYSRMTRARGVLP